MPLKVDYVNQIPSTETKIYDILDSANNKLFEDIKISDQTVYTEEGDSFGATDINATNTQVNANTQSISDIGEILGDVTVEQLALLADVTDGQLATTAFVQQEIAFKGALLLKNTNQSVLYADNVVLTWQVEEYDTNGFFSLSQPTRLVIPSGVNFVRLSASVVWSSAGVGRQDLMVRKNGNDFNGGLRNRIEGATLQSISIITAVVNVQEGDYFEVLARQEFGSVGQSETLTQSTHTWFSLEVLG